MSISLTNTFRWVLLILFTIVGLLYLNGAAYSSWVSWGPPNDYPNAWEQNALVQLGYSITLLSTGILFFKALKKKFEFKLSKYVYFWLVIVVLSLSYPQVREFLLIDNCLDSGGKWSVEYFECHYK